MFISGGIKMNKAELMLEVLKIIKNKIDDVIEEDLLDQAVVLNDIYDKIAKLALEECYGK